MKLLAKLKYYRVLWMCSRLLNMSLRELESADTIEKAQPSLLHIKMLADRGYPDAMEALGWLYSDETKPWYDSRKAIESWKKAAELGSGESMYDMGLFLFNGRKDLKADPVTAKKWMERAAAAGQKDAKLFLQILDHK